MLYFKQMCVRFRSLGRHYSSRGAKQNQRGLTYEDWAKLVITFVAVGFAGYYGKRMDDNRKRMKADTEDFIKRINDDIKRSKERREDDTKRMEADTENFEKLMKADTENFEKRMQRMDDALNALRADRTDEMIKASNAHADAQPALIELTK